MLYLINGMQMDMSVINEVVKKRCWNLANYQRHTLYIISIFMIFSFEFLTESKAMAQIQRHPMKTNVVGKTLCYLCQKKSSGWLLNLTTTLILNTPFMYHCHILEHEDVAMMGLFGSRIRKFWHCHGWYWRQ